MIKPYLKKCKMCVCNITDVYQDDKAGRTYLTSFAHDALLYVGMIGNVAAMFYLGIISQIDSVVAILTYAVVGSYANWLHHTFHIRGADLFL